MSPYRDHSWVVVFQPQNRSYRDTILCPYMVLICYLLLPLYFHDTTFASTSTSSVSPLSTASTSNRDPFSFIHSYSHQLFVTHVPGLRTASSQRSIIGRVSMYCATMFYLLNTYASTSSNLSYRIDFSKGGGYSQLPYRSLQGYLHVIRLATL